jgi:hypothetical protein
VRHCGVEGNEGGDKWKHDSDLRRIHFVLTVSHFTNISVRHKSGQKENEPELENMTK